MSFGFWEIYEKEGLENLPMQEKQLRKLLDSVVSISSSVLTNGRKRFFFTISPAPQIFRLFVFDINPKLIKSPSMSTHFKVYYRENL